jgi:surface protein
MVKAFRDSLLKNSSYGEEYQKLGNKKNIIYRKNINGSVIDKKKIMIKNLNNKIYINASISFTTIFINFLLIIPIISQDNTLTSNRLLQSNIYEIAIKVNEKGNQEILYNGFNTMPDTIYSSNGDVININNNKINIEDNELYYILKWESYLNDCSFMFCNLSNIIEVDLSNFDPSNVKSMKEMFSGCINLKKIIIGNNFNSLIVTDIYRMFFNCTSLISLDLSKFDTSKINKMHNMFYNDKSLKYLDISQFDTS